MGRIFLPLLLTLLFWTTSALAFDAGSSCVKCHGDRETMAKLNAADFYLDPAAVDREVGMGGEPRCVDCHLGDPSQADVAGAHTGLLRPMLTVYGAGRAGTTMSRQELGVGALHLANERPSGLLPHPEPEKARALQVDKVTGLFWHDRDSDRLTFRADIAQKTCGRCHGEQVAEYRDSGMGLLRNQRGDRSFSEKLPGPHNCGPWFGDNYQRLAADTNVPFSKEQNAANDRNCNKCHPGCNDCHYQPFLGEGTHRFAPPQPVTCYGGRRGTICHAGPMERRRGAGFLRDEYAFPGTLYSGAHREAGLSCTDCHSLKDHNSGHMASPEARDSCQKCHPEFVAAIATSDHAKVDCVACHIDEIGGYQFTEWGPGNWAGNETPYAKHAGYFGVRDQPTLLRRADGRWLPYKPFPMAVLNQKNSLKPTGVVFREIPRRKIQGDTQCGEPESFVVKRPADQTNDAFIIVGTRTDLPSGNKAILWIQMDKISHALTFARDCDSCHASHAQISRSEFRYADPRNVTGPFEGSYTVVADAKGLRFENWRWDPVQPVVGRKTTNFALFTTNPEAWNVTDVDLSLPFDEAAYQASRSKLDQFITKVDAALARQKDDATVTARLKRIRNLAHHNLSFAEDKWNAEQGVEKTQAK